MNGPEKQKVDFSKSHKALYTATSRVNEVMAGKATFLSLEGKGEPGGAAFQSAIGHLYSLAHTTKFMLKHSGKIDFAVGKLECLWPMENLDAIPRSDWPWQLLIRIPDQVTESALKKARQEVLRGAAWTPQRCAAGSGRRDAACRSCTSAHMIKWLGPSSSWTDM